MKTIIMITIDRKEIRNRVHWKWRNDWIKIMGFHRWKWKWVWVWKRGFDWGYLWQFSYIAVLSISIIIKFINQVWYQAHRCWHWVS